jgi:GTP cyclohydrolase FolE2
MTNEDILRIAIKKYGIQSQERQAVEECSELILAISHKQRGREHNLIEEIADVEIMLEQLKMINDCHERVESIKAIKIKRLYHRIFNIREDAE